MPDSKPPQVAFNRSRTVAGCGQWPAIDRSWKRTSKDAQAVQAASVCRQSRDPPRHKPLTDRMLL
jgi:hypothetical protein